MPLSGPLATPVGKIVAVGVAAALVAELAVIVLAPGDTGLEPVAVEATDYFAPEAIENARDFRAGQRNLMLIGLGVELAALGLLAAGRPRAVRRLFDRAAGRPLLGAAAVGAGISVLLAVVALPTGLIAHERAVDVGLSTQDTLSWFADRGRSTGISLLIAAAGGAVLIGVQRRLPQLWWVAGAGVVILYATIITWLAPVVLAPVFNDFEELPAGELRTRVVELADRAGVEVGEVLRVDASRRSTALNAYVDGIGSSKRVVLYDNLLDDADQAELESVVAHELGHVANEDIPRGLLFVAIVAPLGMLTIALAGGALARRAGAAPGTPAALPAYALAVTVVAFGIGLAGAQLSRQVEASADAFALQLTEDPHGLIGLQRRLSSANLSDPDPSGPVESLLRTHPTTVQRIGAAIAFERQG